MAVAIQNLNGDASFLLTFEPVNEVGTRDSGSFSTAKPFRILLDPYIVESSACISSLLDIPEPDVVIVSQHRIDHCNEATLRQLPATGTKTIILADSSSARTIKSWKYFEKGRIYTIPEWETPGGSHAGNRPTVLRVGVPPLGYGEPGEMTISLIPQKHNFSNSGLHNAIGITYRPPPTPLLSSPQRRSPLRPHSSHHHLRSAYITTPLPCHTTSTSDNPPPTPSTIKTTTSHRSLRSVRSALSLKSPPKKNCSPSTHDRPLSIIYAPHGIHYSSVHNYVTTHLISEAALPLTALIHPFDSLEQPWWLGGNVLLGAPSGSEIATRLAAKVWIDAHSSTTTTCCCHSPITSSSSSKKGKFSKRTTHPPSDILAQLKSLEYTNTTKVLPLNKKGEEIILTSEAVLNPESLYQDLIIMQQQQQQQQQLPASPPLTPTRTTTTTITTMQQQQHETPSSPPSPVSTTTSARSSNSNSNSNSHKSTPPPRPPRPLHSGIINIPIRPQTTTGHDFRSYTSFANLEEVMFRDRDRKQDHNHHDTVVEEVEEGGGGGGGHPNMI